jgi:hypothetical protein
MERVYLLLRNNQQTGPFTIGELLQQQLKPSDMIWIEGKSAAWTYLNELELSPFVHHAEATIREEHPKNEDEIERKAEELRQRVLASTPKTYFPKYVPEMETYASQYKRSEEDIQFVDHRKERAAKRTAVFGELFLTCIVIGLFVLGIYKGKTFLGIKERVQPSVATQLDTGDEHAAQKSKSFKPEAPVVALDTTSTHVNDSLVAAEKLVQKAVLRKRIIDSALASKLADKPLVPEDKKEDTEAAHPQPVVVQTDKEAAAKKDMAAVVPEVKSKAEPVKEEKKGFLGGLFKKHKKANTDKAEEKDQ